MGTRTPTDCSLDPLLMLSRSSLDTAISLWLVPSAPESALLQQFMNRHPKPGAERSFPHFHPHVTLASIPIRPPPAPAPEEEERFESRRRHDGGGDDVDPTTLLALREAIPLGQRALRNIRFARVLTGDTYFLSIYIALAPSTELAQLRASLSQAGAKLVLEKSSSSSSPLLPAFPHLSLFYVGDEEAHVRVRLLQEMEREGVVRHSDDGLSVALRCAESTADGGEGGGGGGGEGLLEGFTATQIWIVYCEGPVEEWKVLDKILLATS